MGYIGLVRLSTRTIRIRFDSSAFESNLNRGEFDSNDLIRSPTEKAEFMCKLQPYLDENAKIDPASHCTLPSMVVELKVGPNCKVQERPRQFYSQMEKTEVDKTVKQWLKDGVIVLIEGHCPYNSTLMMAARRDLEGKILKHRVCLDPRTLNKQLLDTDQFPLPKISDVHAKVAGAARYSTFDLSQAFHRMKIKEESQELMAFTYDN